jgi:outer membrane cobalamin receptor
VTFKARVENLFDEPYAQVDGYPQLGIGAYAGIEVQF